MHKIILDEETKTAKVDLYAIEQINKFVSDEKEYVLQPEFGRWMVEGIIF
jgi:hypothetical protein